MKHDSQALLLRGRQWLSSWLRVVNGSNKKTAQDTSPEWTTVTDGPAKGCALMLDLGIASDFTREMAKGTFDAFWYDILKQRENIIGATIWDVGAHVGYHSLGFAKLVGSEGHVVAFEPNGFNASRFRLHMERNPEIASRITLLGCALSDADGLANFLVSADVDTGFSSESHLLGAHTTWDNNGYRGYTEVTVETTCADTLFRKGDVPLPSVIKIDVEGAESKVLSGATELLSSVKPLLLMEVHHIVEMFHVYELLATIGYELSLVKEEAATPSRCFAMARHRG